MIHKTPNPKQYTIVPQDLLRDSNLSARDLGLLVKLLSLPPTWRFSVAGLTTLFRDGRRSLSSALEDLERLGYLRRSQRFAADGRYDGYEYDVYDTPHFAKSKSTHTQSLSTDGASTALPSAQSGQQVNMKESRNQKDSNNTLIIDQSIINEMRDEIKEQIEYDALISNHEPKLVDNIVDIMLDVALTDSPYIALSNARSYPVALVQAQYQKLSMEHVDAVLDAFSKVETGVKNLRAYLLTSLFDIVATFNTSVDFAFQRDWGDAAKRTGGRR